MRVVSHRKLKEFYERKGMGESKTALERWYYVTVQAQWGNFQEMKNDFPATDAIGNQRYVFNIHGNKYRLVVVVKFVMGCVFVRFVGTYKEYDRIDCLTI